MHELIKYAKEKHGTTGGRSSTQLKKWLKKNPDFIPRWLRETEWAVDHIISDKLIIYQRLSRNGLTRLR